MRTYPTVFVFRFVLVVTGVVVLNNLLFEQRDGPRALIALTILVGLWLFANLCANIQAIQKRLSSLEFRSDLSEPSPLLPSRPKTEEPKSLFGEVSIRKLGDRVFKADAVKTCINCGHHLSEEAMCDMDGESLRGVTVVALGCQHWVPGLKVAESLSDPKQADLFHGEGEEPSQGI